MVRENIGSLIPQYSAFIIVHSCSVDIRYITSSQKLDVVYEGKKRCFTVSSVIDEHSPSRDKDFSNDLQQLSLETSPKIWIVDWETHVVIEEDTEENLHLQKVMRSPGAILVESSDESFCIEPFFM